MTERPLNLPPVQFRDDPLRARAITQVPSKATLGLVGRNVIWFKSAPNSILRQTLKVLEYIGLAISIVGIPYLIRLLQASKRFDQYKQFEVLKATAALPTQNVVRLKSQTASFNHTHYFLIHNGQIWAKSIHQSDAKWQLIF